MDAVTFKRRRTLFAFPLLFFGASILSGQNNVQPDRFPLGIATVDVGRVFKGCKVFQREMEVLQTEVAEHKHTLGSEAEYLKQLERLIEEATDPVAKERLQVDAATFRTDVKHRISQKKDELLNLEKELYADIIEATVEEVASFAKENSISFVIRRNVTELSRDTRESVLGYANRQILYSSPDIDITDDIISRVNARLAESGTTRGEGHPSDDHAS